MYRSKSGFLKELMAPSHECRIELDLVQGDKIGRTTCEWSTMSAKVKGGSQRLTSI